MKKIEDLINQSLILYKKNKYDDAIKILESIDVNNDYRKYFLLGTIYISLKKIDLAENNLTLANKLIQIIHQYYIILEHLWRQKVILKLQKTFI